VNVESIQGRTAQGQGAHRNADAAAWLESIDDAGDAGGLETGAAAGGDRRPRATPAVVNDAG